MLQRVLEPEVMDSPQEADDYDSMDHGEVNRKFVDDLLAAGDIVGDVLDLGTGTAQIPIELCRRRPDVRVVAVDLAAAMIEVARRNVAATGLEGRVELQHVDAKQLPYADGAFSVVMSNSIVHHIPQPREVLAEAARITRIGGRIFIRDLLRPESSSDVECLVAIYAAGANPRQRQMFADSLRAALSLDEMRRLVAGLGFAESSLQATSDRHWTWSAYAKGSRSEE